MLEIWTPLKELEIFIKIIFYTLQNSLYNLFDIFPLFGFHYVAFTYYPEKIYAFPQYRIADLHHVLPVATVASGEIHLAHEK